MQRLNEMSEQRKGLFDGLLPPRNRLLRGLAIAVALWIFFMVATAYTSAATLLDRVASTDVMRAASGGAWTGKIAWEVIAFVATQVLLHLAFAGLTWLLACATSVVSETARIKFGRIVVGWFCVLAGAALVYNALWYPRTLIGAYYHDAVATPVGPFPAGQIAYFAAFALCGLVLGVAASRLFQRSDHVVRRRSVAGGLGSGVDCGEFAALAREPFGSRRGCRVGPAARHHPGHRLAAARATASVRRHGRNAEPRQVPGKGGLVLRHDHARCAHFLVVDRDPDRPRADGDRSSFQSRREVERQGQPHDRRRAARQAGYHTVYSTDEVRFANIDESYGFDQVITPRIGASDFLIGTYNELPLASLVINTRVGKWLFPFSYANRGVATMFEPETYVERLDREVSFDKPTLFISHLTAAHWPYYTADTPFGVSKPVSGDDRPMYRIGLKTADRMFGETRCDARGQGRAANAVVIVLSDHGEALGLPTDSFFDDTFRVEGLKAPLKMEVTATARACSRSPSTRCCWGSEPSGASGGFRYRRAATSSIPSLSRTSRRPYLASSGSGGIRCRRPVSRCLPMLESGPRRYLGA